MSLLQAVKDGITEMLEQLDLTEDERDALAGDLDAISALADKLADTPTPAGPTPRELGTTSGFIPLTQLTNTLSARDAGSARRAEYRSKIS
ncbi:hypothetical protein SMIR_40075 [Streptomyces mirabilis]|uniref:hypothetical protein n=1 Tax=Streptomyces mirabilis TaxID=68239 RepID=UPI001BB03224|nr:hypothetical protein [Streptomyces mirabilis]QUW85387.1 hypothetical protein SMIR_40075 [Streptomyces mirabilis]